MRTNKNINARIDEKGWGHEVIFADEPEYAGKLLVFNQKGAKFSMHFHRHKKETWYVMSGAFQLDLIDTADATEHTKKLTKGDSVLIEPCIPHRLTCLTDNAVMIEVSTQDSVEDNYRVQKGDSQNG